MAQQSFAPSDYTEDIEPVLVEEAVMSGINETVSPRQVAASARQLARIRWRRAIDRAHRDGEPAASIAPRLGSSVAQVESEIRILMQRPNQLVRTPGEIIDEYVVGERSRTDLIRTLSTWPYTYGDLGVTPGTHPMSSDAWNRGTWDDVRYAESRGLIDNDAYTQISQAANLPSSVKLRGVDDHFPPMSQVHGDDEPG